MCICKHGWKTGDKIQLTMYYYSSASELFKLELYPLGLVELEIIGGISIPFQVEGKKR